MKARPILMHGRSIRSLLAGRKTQTRRIVKPQPQGDVDNAPAGDALWDCLTGQPIYPPYGQTGELLYVRETFSLAVVEGPSAANCHMGDADPILPGEGRIPKQREDAVAVDYLATIHVEPGDGWFPSIHMPRWASRLTLQLTGVRVERVQDIRADACQAEGCEPEHGRGFLGQGYRPAFRKLWDHTNGPGAWERNDWVWALYFRVIHANVDDVLADPQRYGVNHD